LALSPSHLLLNYQPIESHPISLLECMLQSDLKLLKILCKVQITTPIEFGVSLIPADTHHIIAKEIRYYEVALPPKSFHKHLKKLIR
jgi:hypothetical protein